MLDIKLHGPWPGVQIALNQLDPMIRSSATWGMRKSTEKLVKIVKGHINGQDLNWPQRSSGYNAGDPRILVNEGDYYSAIEAYKVGDVYYAGVKPNKINREGAPIKDYALMHEYGGGNLPPRPLWRPSLSEMGGPKGIRSMVISSIYNKVQILRTRGFNVSMINI